MGAQDEVERLTRPEVLDGMNDWPVEQLRDLRDACRRSELRISYLRRLAQGRLDIASAERNRRAHGGDLVDSLAGILADRPSGAPKSDRAVGLVEGAEADSDDMPALPDLPDLSDEELTALIGELQDNERELSRRRRGLLDNLDRLQEELVVRYREGRADVGQIVEPDAEAR